jgi:hypothetical protein
MTYALGYLKPFCTLPSAEFKLALAPASSKKKRIPRNAKVATQKNKSIKKMTTLK